MVSGKRDMIVCTTMKIDSMFSFDIHKNNDKDIVHVALDHVGESSMEDLS